ncbi:854_t:CDS:2, partial [Gigaspora margarita]
MREQDIGNDHSSITEKLVIFTVGNKAIGIPISNTGTENLIIESDEYDAESSNAFDEFDYEREAEDVEGQLMEECEDSPTLYLT